MIKFRCSNCNKKFGVPDDYAGRRIRCNTCDQHTVVPKSSTASPNPPAAADQREMDDDLTQSVSEKDKPTEMVFKLQADSSDNEILTAEDLFKPLKSPPTDDAPAQSVQFQIQSSHNYSPPKPDADTPAPAETHTKKTLTEILNRSHSAAAVDKTELTLSILSFISCIGPVLFALLFFFAMFAIVTGHSHHPIADPNLLGADPNTAPISGPFSALSAFTIIRYSLYAVCFGFSPIALIVSLILVFRHSYDMPKTLYFAIVAYGLIFFNIFRG